ncbi:MAG: TetR/AcrR family transcriptional regulator [Deinococcota bacterium]
MSATKQNRSNPPARILKAARKLFYEHGVDKVSTDMLAAEACTSKMTIYKYFKDKDAIFCAFLDAELERLYNPKINLPDSAKGFDDALIDFGTNLLAFLSDPNVVRFDQMIISQVTIQPELTKLYYDRSYGASYQALEQLIAHGQQQGFTKRTETPDLLASMLLSAWQGKPYLLGLYGVQPVTFPSSKNYVEQILNVILGSC